MELYDKKKAESLHISWLKYFETGAKRHPTAVETIYQLVFYVEDLKKAVEDAECDKVTLPGVLIGLLIGIFGFSLYLFMGQP